MTQTVVVSAKQAEAVAQLMAAAEAAHAQLAQFVSTLALGHVPDGSPFVGVDVAAGALSFEVVDVAE